jgi:hypothetical protein
MHKKKEKEEKKTVLYHSEVFIILRCSFEHIWEV